MRKTRQYIEWRNDIRSRKWMVAKNIIKVGLFILDLCI